MGRLTRPNINVDPGTDRFLHATIGGKEIDWKQCRDSTLNVLINGPTSNGFGKDIFRKMARDLYGRLKDLEDTGLEPEAVETVKLALCAKHMVDLETLNNTPISRLVELASADKDGRCIIPPCKVGDTVYEVTSRKTISEYRVKAIRVELFCTFLEWDIAAGFVDKSIFGVPVDEIGKTVFLTREEAEKALAEMEAAK